MNDIAMFHGATDVVSADALAATLKNQRAADPAYAGGGYPYLKCSQDGGVWLYGAENTDVEEGSRWAVNPHALLAGWVCWSDPDVTKTASKKLGEVMDTLKGEDEPPLPKPSIDHSAAGGVWKQQYGMQLMCLAGEDAGVVVAWTASSAGGADAFKALRDAIDAQLDLSHTYYFPVVELESSSYQSKYGKTVFKPIFRRVTWATQKGEVLEVGQSPAAANNSAPEAIPADPTDTPAEEAPKRRRRRAAS